MQSTYRQTRCRNNTWPKQYCKKAVHRPKPYLDSVGIPAQRRVPSIMSFFLSSRGFRRCEEGRLGPGSSKDIITNSFQQQRIFLLVFFSPNKHMHKKPPPITSKCHRRSARSRGSAGTVPPPTEEGSSSPAHTAAPRILAGMRFCRGALRQPPPGRRT